MCPMLLSSLRDGPTMILSPPQDHTFLQFPHQPMLEASGVSSRPLTTAFSSGVNSFGASVSSGLTTSNKPSRKRSRDDVAVEDTPSDRSVPLPAPQEKPIYGEGMAATSTVASQTHAHSQASRKSQRLDPSAPSLNDVASSRIQRQLQEDNSDDENRRILNASSSRSNPFSPEEPLVDDATRLLGISWQRVHANDGDMAAALRGWKKYIDRQFSQHLADAEILMKNRALNAYLVSARPMIPFAGPAQMPAFYLFNDDLTQGQLVASSWETCLRNLQSSPVVFEGTDILNPSGKPRSSVTLQSQAVLATNPTEPGPPLLRTLTAQPPSAGVGLNDGVGLGTGMDIDL